jgi:hypothetical protein
VQNIAAMDTYGAKILPLCIDVAQNISSLDTFGAKYCPFGQTWCQNIVPV